MINFKERAAMLNKTSVFNPYLEVILAAMIWGSAGAFVKFINLPPPTIGFIRTAIPLLLMFLILIARKRPLFQGNVKIMILASAINALRTYLALIGFLYASLGNGIIMLYTWPVFAAIYGSFFLKETMTTKKVFLLTLALSGIVLIYTNRAESFSDRELIGITAMLLHGVFYAMSVVIFKKESDNNSVPEMIFYQNLLAPFIFLPLIFMMGEPLPSISQLGWGTVYAILIGVIAFGLFFSGLKRIDSFTASLLTYLEIIGAIFLGIIFFGEALTWNILIGGSLIVFSTILLRKPIKQPKKPKGERP